MREAVSSSSDRLYIDNSFLSCCMVHMCNYIAPCSFPHSGIPFFILLIESDLLCKGCFLGKGSKSSESVQMTLLFRTIVLKKSFYGMMSFLPGMI